MTTYKLCRVSGEHIENYLQKRMIRPYITDIHMTLFLL